MAWNGFGKEGAKALGEALPENNKLRQLDLTNNRIDANGMALFMVGLKTNETLEDLRVSFRYAWSLIGCLNYSMDLGTCTGKVKTDY